ncbi:hypothetical protein [Micromonospora sp. LOL_023]|uniref:hypothetical protein n=1 Tax=Micromonospora sp. LOL_023 TaxID=3345418 RepID=UPI003A853B87
MTTRVRRPCPRLRQLGPPVTEGPDFVSRYGSATVTSWARASATTLAVPQSTA